MLAWDPGNDWPPFVAHRDLYFPRDRCSGDRSRDIAWEGGFRQSLVAKGTFDPLHNNDDDCPWKALAGHELREQINDRPDDGYFCSDGADGTQSVRDNYNALCTLGTNVQRCGIRENLVVFGYAFHERFVAAPAAAAAKGSAYFTAAESTIQGTHSISGGTYSLRKGVGKLLQADRQCVSNVWWTPEFGKLITPTWNSADSDCSDGGPGSVQDICYYGTDPVCGKRRFAFKLEDAGPDIPDDTCASGTLKDADGNDVLQVAGSGSGTAIRYGPGNGRCEDGLMWSIYPPGKNPCAPNTDVTDCGYRPPKRPARVGAIAETDTCEVESYKFNPLSTAAAQGDDTSDIEALCSDFSDDLFHTQDLRLLTGDDGPDEECGRGTQSAVCRQVAENVMGLRFSTDANRNADEIMWRDDEFIRGAAEDLGPLEQQLPGTLTHNNYRYREKATYINPNLAGKGACVSPTMLLRKDEALVRPRMYHGNVGTSMVQGFTVWYDKGTDLADNLDRWTKEVCSDGGPGSVRVPFAFGVGIGGYAPEGPDFDFKFFYDFACPYGSQPEACPQREGLQEYQQTVDELEQPSGPLFANCFDEDVPDYECCHAENEFRIHGGTGVIGNDGSEDLEYCGLGIQPNTNGLVNENGYTGVHSDLSLLEAFVMADPDDTGELLEKFGLSIAACAAHCDALVDAPTVKRIFGVADEYGTGTCKSFQRVIDLNVCKFYPTTLEELQAEAGEEGEWDDDGAVLTSPSPLFYAQDGGVTYERPDEGDACPVHYTSYHHTTTGCKAFCRAAFERDGDDDTCMPGKPECANWLDATDFPVDTYVTVNAECICGAKLEELQTAGKYVHTGTVLQNSGRTSGDAPSAGTVTVNRARALHEDDGVDDGHWEWPDAVSQGIDQFHGKTPITPLEHTHTHTHTHSPSLFVCRRAL